MRKFGILTVAVAAAGLMALASPALAQTTVTSIAPTCTIAGEWCVNALTAGGTVSIADLTGEGGDLETNQPLPIGAALLTTDFTNDARAEAGVGDGYGTPGGILSSISITYSYHKAANASQNAFAAPSLKIPVHNPVCGDTISEDCFGTLVYEPTWNQPGFLGSSKPVPIDVWTTVTIDQNNGLFWWTGGFDQPNTAAGPPLRTLSQWNALFSDDFVDANLSFFSIGVGTFNQGQIGYFDNVVIAGTNADASYDFDPAPTFETLGECVSTLIADECSTLSGRDRANCNHEQQMICFDLFDIQ